MNHRETRGNGGTRTVERFTFGVNVLVPSKRRFSLLHFFSVALYLCGSTAILGLSVPHILDPVACELLQTSRTKVGQKSLSPDTQGKTAAWRVTEPQGNMAAGLHIGFRFFMELKSETSTGETTLNVANEPK